MFDFSTSVESLEEDKGLLKHEERKMSSGGYNFSTSIRISLDLNQWIYRAITAKCWLLISQVYHLYSWMNKKQLHIQDFFLDPIYNLIVSSWRTIHLIISRSNSALFLIKKFLLTQLFESLISQDFQ